MFIKEISAIGEDLEDRADFTFTNKIRLKVKGEIRKQIQSAKLGIALLDKYGNRIFSDYCELEYNEIFDGEGRQFEIVAAIPEKLFAPNHYSFLVALLIDGRVFDLVEECCKIRITDNGTELGLHEGFDYGHILVNCLWDTKYE
jgi:hypothetical protein